MTHLPIPARPQTSAPADPGAYAVLRRGGATPASAQAQLVLEPAQAAALETLFRARAMGGDEQSPRFARHAAHVRAVLAEGGFPALTERRTPDGRFVLTPTLAWPAPVVPAPKGRRRG